MRRNASQGKRESKKDKPQSERRYLQPFPYYLHKVLDSFATNLGKILAYCAVGVFVLIIISFLPINEVTRDIIIFLKNRIINPI